MKPYTTLTTLKHKCLCVSNTVLNLAHSLGLFPSEKNLSHSCFFPSVFFSDGLIKTNQLPNPWRKNLYGVSLKAASGANLLPKTRSLSALMAKLRQPPQIIEQSITAPHRFVPLVIGEKGHTLSQSSIDMYREAGSSFLVWAVFGRYQSWNGWFGYRPQLTSLLSRSFTSAPLLFSQWKFCVPIANASPKPLCLKLSWNAEVLRSQRGGSQVEVLLLHHSWEFTVFATSPSPNGKIIQNVRLFYCSFIAAFPLTWTLLSWFTLSCQNASAFPLVRVCHSMISAIMLKVEWFADESFMPHFVSTFPSRDSSVCMSLSISFSLALWLSSVLPWNRWGKERVLAQLKLSLCPGALPRRPVRGPCPYR